jgi:hypothetical protein
LSSSAFKKELELLKESLQAAEEERDRLKNYAKTQDTQKVKVMEDLNRKFQQQVEDLEKELER